MAFEWTHYQFPPKVFFERNSASKIGSFIKDVGSRVLLVNVSHEASNPEYLMTVKNSIDSATSGCILYDDFPEEIGYSDLDTAVHFARQSQADVIVGFGGRESFRAARNIAMLCKNEIFSADIHNTTFPLKKPPLPVITVPIAPTMGEEASPTALIYDKSANRIFCGTDPRLFPAMIFMDPSLTVHLSDTEMAQSGIAIMAASIEAILSRNSNEVTNAVALKSLELVAHNIVTLLNESGNITARSNVSMSSLFAGMAHSNSGLGLCYSISTAVSNLTELDFNTAMGIMLPHVMDFNLTVAAAKYVNIARALDEDIKDITVIEAAIKAVEGVRKIYSELKIPQRLSDFEIRKGDLPSIAAQAFSIPFIKNSVRDLDRNELETILISAY
jgi:alcohol dehydrogenase